MTDVKGRADAHHAEETVLSMGWLQLGYTGDLKGQEASGFEAGCLGGKLGAPIQGIRLVVQFHFCFLLTMPMGVFPFLQSQLSHYKASLLEISASMKASISSARTWLK